MARHNSPTTVPDDDVGCGRPRPELWRAALGPGYAVGPSGRLVDLVARTSCGQPTS